VRAFEHLSSGRCSVLPQIGLFLSLSLPLPRILLRPTSALFLFLSQTFPDPNSRFDEKRAKSCDNRRGRNVSSPLLAGVFFFFFFAPRPVFASGITVELRPTKTAPRSEVPYVAEEVELVRPFPVDFPFRRSICTRPPPFFSKRTFLFFSLAGIFISLSPHPVRHFSPHSTPWRRCLIFPDPCPPNHLIH